MNLIINNKNKLIKDLKQIYSHEGNQSLPFYNNFVFYFDKDLYVENINSFSRSIIKIDQDEFYSYPKVTFCVNNKMFLNLLEKTSSNSVEIHKHDEKNLTLKIGNHISNLKTFDYSLIPSKSDNSEKILSFDLAKTELDFLIKKIKNFKNKNNEYSEKIFFEFSKIGLEIFLTNKQRILYIRDSKATTDEEFTFVLSQKVFDLLEQTVYSTVTLTLFENNSIELKSLNWQITAKTLETEELKFNIKGFNKNNYFKINKNTFLSTLESVDVFEDKQEVQIVSLTFFKNEIEIKHISKFHGEIINKTSYEESSWNEKICFYLNLKELLLVIKNIEANNFNLFFLDKNLPLLFEENTKYVQFLAPLIQD